MYGILQYQQGYLQASRTLNKHARNIPIDENIAFNTGLVEIKLKIVIKMYRGTSWTVH